jgi:hypothetical protein
MEAMAEEALCFGPGSRIVFWAPLRGKKTGQAPALTMNPPETLVSRELPEMCMASTELVRSHVYSELDRYDETH